METVERELEPVILTENSLFLFPKEQTGAER